LALDQHAANLKVREEDLSQGKRNGGRRSRFRKNREQMQALKAEYQKIESSKWTRQQVQ
jgi:hypothetical protein